MTEYYVLSHRHINFSPAQGCLIEFEDVLIDCCNATLIAPVFPEKKLKQRKFFDNLINLNLIEIPAKKFPQDKQVLIIVVMSIFDYEILKYIQNWRTRFDVVCGYIFDSFLPNLGTKTFSRFSRLLGLVNSSDYLFIPMSGTLEKFKNIFDIPVKMIPLAGDVVKFGSCKTERWIDVMGYGRQLIEHSQIFETTYNNPKSDRIYYYTSHRKIERITDISGHRKLFWKLLINSRIALAYDMLATPEQRIVSCSLVGQRWFECLAAGCVIIGRRPQCPEADQLLNWEYATIEVPHNKSDLIPFVESLLTDEQLLKSIHHRNYIKALTYHDWRYRVADILNCLDLDQPESLQKALYELDKKVAIVNCT